MIFARFIFAANIAAMVKDGNIHGIFHARFHARHHQTPFSLATVAAADTAGYYYADYGAVRQPLRHAVSITL